MEKEFSLESILTATTGISCVDSFDEFFELAWFVFNDDGINTLGLGAVKDDLKNHLLTIHPQLAGVQYNPRPGVSFELWKQLQKLKYGEILPVCQIGQTLSAEPSKGKSR